LIDWQVCVVSVCRIWTSHQTLLLVQLWAVRQANWTIHLMFLVSNMPLINFLSTDRRDSCFQCFYTVGWASERASGCKDWVMRCCCGYLSGARCRLFEYGPVDASASRNPHHLLPHLNPDCLLPFWYWLTQVVMEKMLLDGCSVVVVVINKRYSNDCWLLMHICRPCLCTYQVSVQLPTSADNVALTHSPTAAAVFAFLWSDVAVYFQYNTICLKYYYSYCYLFFKF